MIQAGLLSGDEPWYRDVLGPRGGPAAWHGPLLPYQVEGVQALLSRDSLLLADDMGLGKTIQAIAAIRILLWQQRLQSALIVAPAGLLRQWQRELRLWAPEVRVLTVHGNQAERSWQWKAPVAVYLTSYETLRSDYYEQPASPPARLWDLVVLDEAQKIKNAGTGVSRVCKQLRTRRQWALTGTPLENRPDDVKSILSFVSPHSPHARRPYQGPLELRAELRQVQLRRRKADVLPDLPPKLVSPLSLPLTRSQRRVYDRAEQEGVVELRAMGEHIRVQHILALIARLKQICNFCPSSGQSSKMDDLRERVSVLVEEGHKALIFSQFSNAEYGARRIADELEPQALVYAGDLSQGEREAIVQRFRADDGKSALVLSVRAGGLGLNLQQASYVFHFDRWWNPATQNQADGRSHRLGQRSPVNVYTYTCERTIEERIEQILEDKQVLFDDLVDGVSMELPPSLSSEELFRLFDLRPPRSRG
ncbi:MAG TPA: DEAD/DEAH box helicase [Chloroflexota bacterium]|nr:DEAD/DEAH box helicase [Chloroflexota bacterium]